MSTDSSGLGFDGPSLNTQGNVIPSQPVNKGNEFAKPEVGAPLVGTGASIPAGHTAPLSQDAKVAGAQYAPSGVLPQNGGTPHENDPSTLQVTVEPHTPHTHDFTPPQGKAGDTCTFQGKQGVLQDDNGVLVCVVS